MSEERRPSLLRRPLVGDIAVVLGWFLVLGVLGAVVWWKLTPLAAYTRTATNGVMDEEQLARQVSADGWFIVVAAVGGLVSGVALLAWRRRDPLGMVVLVTLGGALATWVMLRVGLWLGPANPHDVLPHAKVGAKVPLQLKPHVHGVYFVWSITALLGVAAVILGTEDRTREGDPDASAAGGSPSTTSVSEPATTMRTLIADVRFTPVRIGEGYAMGGVDSLIDEVLAASERGEDVAGLIARTQLTRVRRREGYDIGDVDQFLEQIRRTAQASTMPGRS